MAFDSPYTLLLDPTSGLDGGGAPEEPTPDPTAGLTPEELAAPPDPTGGLGGEAGGATPASPQAAPAETPIAQTVREAARYYGLDLDQYQDDGQAFAHLVQLARAGQQRDFYAELGQRIAPHADAVQQYLRDYEQRQEAQQPAERKPWEAPEFDERWLGLVDRDPQSGRYIPRPGVNPAIADKVNDYADHVDRWTTQLARDPRAALAPMIQEVAQELMEQRFGQHQARAEAQQIIEQNAAWLYQHDAQGRRMVDQANRYLPSALGARYYTHLQVLQRAGVQDARTLDALAKQLLQSDLAAAQAQGGAAPGPQARAAMGGANVNAGQAVDPSRRGSVAGATDPDDENLTLAERMRKAMREEGITDDDFAVERMFAPA